MRWSARLSPVSFDLFVFDRDVPDDGEQITEMMEDDSRWHAELSPRLAAFVADLEHRYPGLDDEPDDSPWASWPLSANSMVDGHCCGFNIVWSRAEQMSAEMRALSATHGLTLYDPQDDVVVRTGDTTQAKRRWWKRR